MATILLTGGTGQIGSELKHALACLGEVAAPARAELDLTSADSIRAAVRAARPDIIVNAAGYTMVDQAETEGDLAMRVNGDAPGIMAEEAKRAGALLVHYSTDYVYDGELERPYREDDVTNPVNTYGRTKLAGERAIGAVGAAHLILRTSWVYGDRRPNFVLTILRLARERPELAVVNDQTGSPSWARVLAATTAQLLGRRERLAGSSGVFHLSAADHVSRYEFARSIIAIMQEISGSAAGWATIRPITSKEYPLPARRPREPRTSKDKLERVFGIELTAWEAQLRAYLKLRSHGPS